MNCLFRFLFTWLPIFKIQASATISVQSLKTVVICTISKELGMRTQFFVYWVCYSLAMNFLFLVIVFLICDGCIEKLIFRIIWTRIGKFITIMEWVNLKNMHYSLIILQKRHYGVCGFKS